MCVMSMVYDHYSDKWGEWVNPPMVPLPYYPPPATIPLPDMTEEIAEFHRLLERARKYDKEHNQPECESEDKKRLLKELVAKLGVKIEFLE